MPNPAAATRDRILQQGLALMSQAGLGGVTLGVLADQVGMSKSGLFAHFRSKEDVQVDLLTHMAEFATERVVRPSMKAGEGLPRLRALVANWFGWAQRAGLPGGCPVAAGLFEFDDVEGRVRNKILEMEAGWRRMLLQLVERAVELGHLRRDLDVEQFIWELCGIYLGHHAAHRFLRSADADARAENAFSALLDRALPSKSQAEPLSSTPLFDTGEGKGGGAARATKKARQIKQAQRARQKGARSLSEGQPTKSVSSRRRKPAPA